MEINREAEIWMRNEDTKIKAVKDKKEKEIFKESNSDYLISYLLREAFNKKTFFLWNFP